MKIDKDVPIPKHPGPERKYPFPALVGIGEPRNKHSARSSVRSEFSVWNRGVEGSNPSGQTNF